MTRVYDIIFASSIAISAGDIINVVPLNAAPLQIYNINGLDLLRNGIITSNRQIANLNTPVARAHAFNFNNGIFSLPITIEKNEILRTDFVLGGGNYINLFNNDDFNYQDFVNILQNNHHNDINHIVRQMLSLYCCECSRDLTNFIAIPLIYQSFDNQGNNVLSEILTDLRNINILEKTINTIGLLAPIPIRNSFIFNDQYPYHYDDIDENGNRIDNYDYAHFETIFRNNAMLFPPVFYNGAVNAMRGIKNGFGNQGNATFINENNDFFALLNFHNNYDLGRGDNVNNSKAYMLQTEIFMLDFFNQAEIITQFWDDLMHLFDDDNDESLSDTLRFYITEQYTGTEIDANQTNILISSILNFFNDTFNLGWVEEDNEGVLNEDNPDEGRNFNEAQNTIASRLRLVLRILEHPENTNDLITEFINFPQQFIGNAGEDHNNDNPMQDGVEQ
jgi:hypothetical protein